MANATSATLRIEGVDIAYQRDGVGPPVVCLHSVGHDRRDFDPLVSRCGHAFEFIRIDWPGHGGSGGDRVPASAERYAQLAEGLLDSLSIADPILIGNSIGGAAAILYASRRTVRGLVLCDSGGLTPVTGAVRVFCGLFERFFAAGARGAVWYPTLFALYYRLVLTEPAAQARRHEIIADARPMAPRLREAWASFARPEADLRAMAAAIAGPVWVAWARSDRVIPLALVRPAIHRLKNASLTLFRGGHTPFLEDPDAFATEFRRIAGQW